jgi:hypothetical protein
VHSLSNCGVIIEMATHNSFFLTKSYQYFVFMTATAENPASHRYVITKESNDYP